MVAYILARPDDMSHLKTLMPLAKSTSLTGYGLIKKPTGRLARLLNCLNDAKGADLPIGDVEKVTGIEPKYIKETALNNEWEIEKVGYRFQVGEKGRGKSAQFIWIQ